jgi:para-nitrobenzyl esterase
MMGQSAGALDICLLMASNEARGLFSKAIVESAPGLGPPDTQTLPQAEAAGADFAARLGCADIAALRAVPAPELLAAAEREHIRGRIDVDGWILREPPAALFASGREARLPLLIGTNARESSFRGTTDDLRELIAKHYGTLAQRAFGLYGLSGAPEAPAVDPALGDIGAQYLTDTTFRLPTLLVAQWHRAAGASVWMYLFSETPKGREELGASHSSELAYVFGELGSAPPGIEYRAEDRRVSAEMQRYWANFAATGNPNGPRLLEWTPYDTPSGAYLEFRGAGSALGKMLRQPYFELYSEDFQAKLAQ